MRAQQHKFSARTNNTSSNFSFRFYCVIFCSHSPIQNAKLFSPVRNVFHLNSHVLNRDGEYNAICCDSKLLLYFPVFSVFSPTVAKSTPSSLITVIVNNNIIFESTYCVHVGSETQAASQSVKSIKRFVKRISSFSY